MELSVGRTDDLRITSPGGILPDGCGRFFGVRNHQVRTGTAPGSVHAVMVSATSSAHASRAAEQRLHGTHQGDTDSQGARSWGGGVLGRTAEVARNPARCVRAHGQGANQRGQVRLKGRELGRTDLQLPLAAQLVEDRFTSPQALRSQER